MSLVKEILKGTYRVALFPIENDKVLTGNGKQLRDDIRNGRRDYKDYEDIDSSRIGDFIDLGRIYANKGFVAMNVLKADKAEVDYHHSDDVYFIYIKKA